MARATTAKQAEVTPVSPARLGNDEVELLVMEYEETKAKAKQLYDQCDRIEQRLISALGLTQQVTLGDGRTVRVDDNFVDKNGQPKLKAWGMAGIKRFEIAVK